MAPVMTFKIIWSCKCYILKVKELLTGKISDVMFDKDSVLQAIQYNKDSLNLSPTEQDLEFRSDIERLKILK